MTDTPQQPRELAIEAAMDVTYAGVQLGRAHAGAVVRAVLAAVTPVIRRQERAAVAEEIARAIGEECRGKLIDIPGMRMSPLTPATLTARHTRDLVAASAAAIARSHSTQPTEEET